MDQSHVFTMLFTCIRCLLLYHSIKPMSLCQGFYQRFFVNLYHLIFSSARHKAATHGWLSDRSSSIIFCTIKWGWFICVSVWYFTMNDQILKTKSVCFSDQNHYFQQEFTGFKPFQTAKTCRIFP